MRRPLPVAGDCKGAISSMLMDPKRPARKSDHAVACLSALDRKGMGHLVSIGGALGLAQYLDYRETHDLHAWWSPVTTGQRKQVLDTVSDALRPSDEVQQRSCGDVQP